MRAQSEMEFLEWEEYSYELARTPVDAASRDLANAHTSLEQKARATKLLLGFHWAKKAIRAAGAAKI